MGLGIVVEYAGKTGAAGVERATAERRVGLHAVRQTARPPQPPDETIPLTLRDGPGPAEGLPSSIHGPSTATRGPISSPSRCSAAKRTPFVLPERLPATSTRCICTGTPSRSSQHRATRNISGLKEGRGQRDAAGHRCRGLRGRQSRRHTLMHCHHAACTWTSASCNWSATRARPSLYCTSFLVMAGPSFTSSVNPDRSMSRA